jgi:histidyl-tRNA synthetase
VDYFSQHKDRLSNDSVSRLERNPLRILDSKDDGDRAVVADAPRFSAYLTDHARAFFQSVCAGLDVLGIPYTYDERLVRGLDYYAHTAFEFVTTGLGAQGSVLAGGRYDGLIEQMGGPATPGVGWAGGIERLALLMDRPVDAPRPVILMPLDDDSLSVMQRLAQAWRADGMRLHIDHRGNLKKRLNRANKVGARAAVIMGDDERRDGVATVRDLDTGDQRQLAIDEAFAALTAH